MKRLCARITVSALLVWCLALGMGRRSVAAEQWGGGSAAGTLATSGIPGLQTRISLDIRDAMDVVDLLKFLALKGGLNMVISQDVAGTAKLMLQDVAVGDALEIVLATSQLAYEIRGDIIRVMTDTDYQREHGRGFYDSRRVETIQLTYATPSRVASLLAPVKSDIGKLVHDDATGTLILMDTPGHIAQMKDIVARTELPTVQRTFPTLTRTFRLQHATVEDVKAAVAEMMTPEIGLVMADTRTKSLVVTDLPQKIVEIAGVIEVFDREPKQVFVEAKVVQVSLNDDFRMGINWNYVFNSIDPVMALGARQDLSLSHTAAGDGRLGDAGEFDPFSQLTFHTVLGDGDLEAILEALETVGESKILSNPHIAVLDGEEAEIKVVENQPYLVEKLETGSTNVVAREYEFVEVGVSLGVSPRINDEGMITLGIRPEVSKIRTWYRGLPQTGTPVVQKSYSETSVMVKDGETIIIAGMVENEEQDGVVRVPLLGSIPLLGNLFRYKRHIIDNRETVVFLTPRIVTGTASYTRLKDTPKGMKPLRDMADELEMENGDRELKSW